MTSLLALDSSTDACSVALYLKGEIQTRFELAAKSHTQRLLPMVDELLAEAGIGLKQLDAIAFGQGPGSFTGLRICMGVVQGLAFGADLPVIPVSTLASMALAYYEQSAGAQLADSKILVPALDARMNEVYWAAYRIQQGLPGLVGDEAVTPVATLGEQMGIKSFAGEFVAIGQGWHYPELQQIPLQQPFLSIFPNAETIAKIAVPRALNGQTASIIDTYPVYLRDSVSWQKRPAARRQIKIDS